MNFKFRITKWRAIGIVLLSVFIIHTSAPPCGATTITGTVTDAAEAGITGKVELALSAPGRVADPALVVIQPPVSCAIAAGSVAAACEVRGNDTISDPAETTYRVRLVENNGKEIMASKQCSITGSTWDLSQIGSCK